ncbi:MAG: zeta toxin [Sphingobacteriales bacterium]|nr:MAG: zeta toxin [Sphingobacteriales bacterium]
MPNLYIIAGCNGAGKTTASFTVLPELLNCKEFVNADEIARGLSPFQPEKVAIEAGRIMLSRISDLLSQKADFAFETTLSTRSYIRTIQKAKAEGYTVILLYFWLNSPELAIERVKKRVAEGGHNIAEDVIRRRYFSGIENLFILFIPKVDEWTIFDNSLSQISIVAGGTNAEQKIYNSQIWETLKNKSK